MPIRISVKAMSKAQNLLLLSDRPDLLERVFQTPPASSLILAVATHIRQFQDMVQRATFHGFALDTALTGPQTWDLVLDLKIRRAASFVVLLTDQTSEDGLKSLTNGSGGWHFLCPPYPMEGLSALLQKEKSLLFYQDPDASAESPFTAVQPLLKKRGVDTAKDLTEAAAFLEKKPEAFLVLHVSGPHSSHIPFLRDVTQKHPGARLLFLSDRPLPDATRLAVRNNGWMALPRPHGVPFLLEQVQEVTVKTPLAQTEKERILIVDDEPNLLEFVSDILTEYGYDVDSFPSGATALAAIKEKQYDVALVDFQLGDTTGLVLSREFRQIDGDLNVILMTAHASLDMAVKAIQADIYDYLIKPVDTNHLRRSISKALEKRRLALEIKALVADLTKANSELQRLNELKSRFLSIVTHDLRTPLTSIKGYAQVLTTQKELPAEQKEFFLGVVVKEADHLNALINDLMDFVSIEAGKLRVEKTPGSLSESLEGLRMRMASLSEQKKIRYDVVIPQGLPAVAMDRRRIDQVLTNLVSNAFKHTPEGGAVTVEATLRDNVIRVEVRDSGEGIPPEDLSRIFEQFYQVESHVSKREGIGLGLSIAREIIQAHGGEIRADSAGKDKGSCFSFTLPVKTA